MLPLAIFFVLACAPVWLVVSLGLTDAAGLLLGTLAPTFAALLVVAMTAGRAGLAELRRRAFLWRAGPRWVAAAIVIPALCVLVPIVIANAVAPDAYQARPMTAANQAVLAGVLIFAFLEELGWMGYAMPKLLESTSSLAAALVVGVMQGLYHLPVLLLSDVPISIPATLLFTVSIRVLMTWIYLATGGSVLYAALFHGTLNAVSSFVVAGINRNYFDLVYPAGFAVAAAIVIVATRGRLRMPGGIPQNTKPGPALG